MMEHITCPRCGLELPLESFALDRKNKTGRQSYCRSCNSQYQREWRANNPKYQRGWREKNPNYHPKYQALYQPKYAREKPEVRRANDHARRARLLKASLGGSSKQEVKNWIKRQKKQCYWCGIKCARSFHIDHYKPLSRGGLHHVHNLVIACPSCNQSKHAKDPLDFAIEKGRLF